MFDWLQRPDGPPRWLPVIALVIALVIGAAVRSGSLTLVAIVAALATTVAVAAVWHARTARPERSERPLN
jgi:hypothetical protein